MASIVQEEHTSGFSFELAKRYESALEEVSPLWCLVVSSLYLRLNLTRSVVQKSVLG
jgi:hypothetical protein